MLFSKGERLAGSFLTPFTNRWKGFELRYLLLSVWLLLINPVNLSILWKDFKSHLKPTLSWSLFVFLSPHPTSLVFSVVLGQKINADERIKNTVLGMLTSAGKRGDAKRTTEKLALSHLKEVWNWLQIFCWESGSTLLMNLK